MVYNEGQEGSQAVRILYIDIDSLRPDHLGCYGYGRNTSPTIDALAKEGTRFDNVFVSDAPCLPSRTAFTQGRFGIKNGVVNHGGRAADLRSLGAERSFNVRPGFETFFQVLQGAGLFTASVSPFPQRHGGWWFLAGLHEWHNTGKNGNENADEVNAKALPWLHANAERDDWFLHVNYWDPHTAYSTPEGYGNPFADDPPPAWYSEGIRQRHWEGFGTLSAQDGVGYFFPGHLSYQRAGIPTSIASLGDYKAWIDGYDTGIRYADDHIAQLLDVLAEKKVLDDTLIVVTADHGENQGELNVYGDHQTADLVTCRVPFIMRHPGLVKAGRRDAGLHYQFDMAATLLALLGIEVPWGWDARSFAPTLQTGESTGEEAGREAGREYLVLSQMAWSCQRSVRWDDWLLIKTYHAGLKDFPELMLFDVVSDPHELHNLASERPEVVNAGLAKLESWHSEMLASSHTEPTDPMQTVLREGGPFHARGRLAGYAERLRATGRAEHAERLEVM